MANEFVIKNGFLSQGDSQVTGSLNVTGGITGSFSGSISAPGSNTQIIYNNGGVLDANSGFVYDGGGRINLEASAGPSYATFQRTGGGAATIGADSDTNAYLQSSTNIKFIPGGSYIPKMFISSSGNVGIGTDTPSASLHVKGAGTTNATEALRITDSNNSPIIVAQDGGNVGIGTTPNSFFKLHLSGSNNLDFGGTTIGKTGLMSLQHGTMDAGEYSALGGVYFENSDSSKYQNDIVFKTTTPLSALPFGGSSDIFLWERFRIGRNSIKINEDPGIPGDEGSTTRLIFDSSPNSIEFCAATTLMKFFVYDFSGTNPLLTLSGMNNTAAFNTAPSPTSTLTLKGLGTTSNTLGLKVTDNNDVPILIVQDDKRVGINKENTNYENQAWYDLHVSGTAAANDIIVGNTIGIQPAVNPVYGPPVMLFNFTSSEAGYANVDFRIDTWPQLITIPYYNTPTVFTVKYDSKVGIGVNNTQPTAQLHIKTEGSSSATQALRVETSGSLEVFKILDDGSATQGFNNTASGNYSHAEGISTKTGIVGAYRCLFSGPPPNPITGSIFTLDPSYGVNTSSFTVGNQLQIYNPSNTQTWSSTISSVSFDGIATKVLVNTPSLYFIGGIIADIDTSLRGDAVIPARAAHAEGSFTKAYGFNSHAEGLGSEAIGLGSHAEGNDTTARGDGSHAEGYKTITTGDYSHTEGYLTTSSGDYSHAEGSDTQAIGNYSHAEGEITEAVGSYSHAEGSDTQAIGNYSHAEGSRTIASGSYSHAEGSTARALGSYSHAEGISSYSYGDYSHAEGFATKTGIAGAYEATPISSGVFTLSSTYGDVSSNFGIGNDLYVYNLVQNVSSVLKITNSYFDSTNTIVEVSDTSYNSFIAYIIDLNYPNGDKIIDSRYSHAEGYGTLTIGNGSHAEGENTTAVDWYQHVQGRHNLPVNGRGAFVIGNGSDPSNRSNLIFASGSTAQVTGSLDVKGTITTNGTNIQALSIAYAIALG
jgi:hypothetical protein